MGAERPLFLGENNVLRERLKKVAFIMSSRSVREPELLTNHKHFQSIMTEYRLMDNEEIEIEFQFYLNLGEKN